MADSESKNIKGTNVASGIVPFTTDDKYPTHYAQYGKGGYRTVNNITERDDIPSERLEEGMLVYVINDADNIHTYQYIKDKTTNKLSWQRASFSAQGIPVYDQKTLDDLGDAAADNYIFIPSEGELEGGVPANQTEIVTHGGSYLNILFSAIRQLQVEVAKMRNAFRYGLNSYTGTQTAMSTQVNEEIEDPDEEPLWAIEPDMLSVIAGAEVIIDGTTAPSNLTPGNNITLEETKLIINSTGCTWSDVENIVKNTEDTKLFLYLTFGKGDSTTFDLKVKLEDINVEEPTPQSEGEEGETPSPTHKIIDLKTLLNTYGDKITNLTKYNILIIVSRQHDELGGNNYVWVSVGSPEDGKVAGYYNFNDGLLYDLKLNLDYSKYTFKEIELKSLDLYQLDFYSKYQDFSNEVSESDTTIPEAPSDNDYKYKVAHITIRSIENKETMESIQHQLLENELIFNEEDKTLWIKMKNIGLVSIAGSGSEPGGGGNNDDIMTTKQIIDELKKLGIIYGGEFNEENDEYDLNIAAISDITFIHQATGKKFKFGVNAEGELRSTILPTSTLKQRIDNLANTVYKIDETTQYRGFVAKLHASEAGKAGKGTTPIQTKDLGLNSDRIKIGAVYMPRYGDTKFGCSHAFIEFENTSDKDFPLEGCYLHYLHPQGTAGYTIDCLKLEGIIPAGSTFLIRGKQYADNLKSSNTYITVDDYDMEWYVSGELIDLTYENDKSYTFVLTYGQFNEETGTSELDTNSALITNNMDDNTKEKAPKLYPWYFIDSIVIEKHCDDKKPWAAGVAAQDFNNSIIKNTFELDPAKQAYQGLTEYDSSRYRFKNPTNDVQILNLDKEFIEFPHTNEKYSISKYTPKSSKQGKNVSTDKTTFNIERPNAVSCAFGINSYTTRCFNWVSAGEFDEFVWLKNSDNTWKKFESYTAETLGEGEDGSEIPTQSGDCPRKKKFSKNTINAVYARIINDFPGCKIHYTSHKCIIEFDGVTTPTTYTYVVGRADTSDSNIPDINHSSEEYTFTLYPSSYKPRIFLTTDQQGFHWIEYQVWTSSANFLSNKINNVISEYNNTSETKIFPVLLNSGDMTQNGTRVNEWLDYFNGGKSLFNHLEHMAIVGNNDLGNPDVTILGTGDDNGKSNPYFFHIFTCYEVFEKFGETKISPIVNNKYIPSLYYFDAGNYRFLMANSELTLTACDKLYNLKATGDQESTDYNRVYNIYTGYGVSNNSNDNWSHYNNGFTSIYTMMWNILNDAKTKGKKTIVTCHEMPFTVITTECLHNNFKDKSRSVNEKNSLVGCHMNQITNLDNKAQYWFSRLCEFFKVKLVLGGHKHTYAITHPVREYYFYKSSPSNSEYDKNSLTDGPMTMPDSLEYDDIRWSVGGKNYSKFPILNNYIENTIDSNGNETTTPKTDYFYPYTSDSNETTKYGNNFVTYLMCQATGYKQTSNKELPTNYQSFSKLIPNSTIEFNNDGSVKKSSADNQQKYPMYVDVDVISKRIFLKRICNIQKNYKFTQSTYSKDPMKEEYAYISNTRVSIVFSDIESAGTVSTDTNYKTKYCSWVNFGNSDDFINLTTDDITNITTFSSKVNNDTINRLYSISINGDNKIAVYKGSELPSSSNSNTTYYFELVSQDTGTLNLTDI